MNLNKLQGNLSSITSIENVKTFGGKVAMTFYIDFNFLIRNKTVWVLNGF